MERKGFRFNGKRIYFIDPRGKDISFDRWRVSLYYKPDLAMTHFLPSEPEYNAFLAAHQPVCYQDYQDYRQIG